MFEVLGKCETFALVIQVSEEKNNEHKIGNLEETAEIPLGALFDHTTAL